MKKQSKSEQLQIRVSPAQKAAIRRRAKQSGMRMSEWVLAQVLPAAGDGFQAITAALAEAQEPSYALAELNDLLADLTNSEYQKALSERPRVLLSPLWESYVAAMIEHAGAQKGISPPDWTREVPPLEEPFFGSSLPALRVHLMMHSPPPFHRRNIFIDSSVGDRV